ncbi:relaxase/mobilization nuclease domain-containing protein [Rhodococcus sp. F64268]|uniref:relaxase/mobilization nuclease domain-containing protein n=1 Tax=Rhodococcus sp. F64268 TaxID=2926402 RepID=UPI001FF5DB99|nr:relaxase/mobilization nuclease domain-containing protein [Rhodococcus sp. F64268]MCK0089771.1 relaxase/mobilization nuclease domain-containing protein [Rhodococcus sp. F64268]
MSTVNVRSSQSARSSVDYALYGDSGQLKEEHRRRGTSRAAALSSSVDNPAEFIARCEDHGRKVELYSYTQNFSPDEFDVNNPNDVKRVNDLGRKLAEDMHIADYLVVTHADSRGSHLHNHIYVCNNDLLTGKSLQRNTSWAKGVHQANDALMEREGCQVLDSPMQAKVDWSLQREQYEAGGFEQTLGDKIAASLRDPRSTDREAYKAVLAEHDVKFSVAKSGEHRYKMRHPNGKLLSKSGKVLSLDFSAESADEIFNYHSENKMKGQTNAVAQRHEERGPGRADERRELGAVARVDDSPEPRRGARRRADDRDQQPHRETGQRHTEPVRAADDDGAAAAQHSAAVQRGIRDRARAAKARRDREDAERTRRQRQRQRSALGHEGPQRRDEGRYFGQ